MNNTGICVSVSKDRNVILYSCKIILRYNNCGKCSVIEL